ncbi:CHAT domain-containing protein, partial [Candidatus Accumulibacter phosphatis]
DYARAVPLEQRALAIREEVLGAEHPDTATSLHNLALLYQMLGDVARAEQLSEHSLAIYANVFGPEHPHTARSLTNVAILDAGQGRLDQALSGLARAARAEDRLLGEIFALSPEEQRNRYLAAHRELGMMLLSLVLAHFRDLPDAVRLALDYVLRRKALAAEAASVQRRAILSGRYPQLRVSLQRLDLLRGQVASKILRGLGAHETPQQYQQALARWRDEREALESEIARQIPEMRLEHELASADARAVALHLQASGTLVEFVRFHPCHFQAVKARGKAQWGRERYAAFVLAAGEGAAVQLVDLGDAAPIDDAIRRFRAEITGDPLPPNDDQARMAPTRDATPPQSNLGAGGELLRLLIAPLQELFQQRPSLVLAPDGELNRLSFAALPTDSGCLSDRYAIRYVSCGRDLVRFAEPASNAGSPPLIVADPAFDLGASASANPGSGPRSRATSVAATQPGKMAALCSLLGGRGRSEDERSPDPAGTPRAALAEASGEPAWTGRRSRDLDRAGYRFTPLPGSRVEGEAVARHLGTGALLGEQALEGRCKKRRSPTIVHLATHGFFLEDQPREHESGSLGDAGHRLSHQENPLLRSGLALAGANTFLREHRVVADEMEDGLLTAEDVAGLDLLDTDLVFLSACETGLGDVQVGEGVFGLRRAFVVAGARTLIMSLWKVDDVATALLVDRFYTALLAGDGKGEALRQAQHELRSATVGTLRATWLNPENRSRLAAGDPAIRQQLNALLAYPEQTRPFQDPYYWAGFILQGDDGAGARG